MKTCGVKLVLLVIAYSPRRNIRSISKRRRGNGSKGSGGLNKLPTKIRQGEVKVLRGIDFIGKKFCGALNPIQVPYQAGLHPDTNKINDLAIFGRSLAVALVCCFVLIIALVSRQYSDTTLKSFVPEMCATEAR